MDSRQKNSLVPCQLGYVESLDSSRGGRHTSKMGDAEDAWRPTFGFFNHSLRFRPVAQDKTGGNGAIVVYEEKLVNKDTRKIVVKRAVGSSSKDGLEKEIKYLEVTRH